MCEYSGKLVAWLDGELPDSEATNVEWHVGQCDACRSAVNAYQEVSRAFLPCYEATLAHPRRSSRIWIAMVSAAAAILFSIFLRPRRAEQLPLYSPTVSPAPAVAFTIPPKAPIAARLKRVQAPQQIWMEREPVVQVALPADALFPPGAMPAGFSFIADVRTQP
jgi:anti-sigma factor RsiW